MTTIDKLDLSVYDLYAIRTKMIEQINQQYRLDQASSIPPQTMVMDIYPKLSELDLLLGIVPVRAPWAYFYAPKSYFTQRRSPFAFYRVAPTMGSLEKQEEDEQALVNTACQTEEEEKEKKVILSCFKEIKKLNSWLGFIIGRVGQFLQG